MKKENSFSMTLRKLPLTFSLILFYFLYSSALKADLIKPKEVVKIQLTGLMNNDDQFKDRGIEQTWSFAHPDNKKNTGPLPNFKMMIKGRSYPVSYTHLTLPTIYSV